VITSTDFTPVVCGIPGTEGVSPSLMVRLAAALRATGDFTEWEGQGPTWGETWFIHDLAQMQVRLHRLHRHGFRVAVLGFAVNGCDQMVYQMTFDLGSPDAIVTHAINTSIAERIDAANAFHAKYGWIR